MKKCNAYEDSVHRGLCKCDEEIEVRTLEVTDKLVEDAAIATYANEELITWREAKRKYKFWALPTIEMDRYLNDARFLIEWTLDKLKVPHEDSDDVKVGKLLRTLRENGWSVSSHHDYPYRGHSLTRWMFFNSPRMVEGIGATDLEALEKVMKETGM
jgi:hypothetical protein